MIHTQKSNCKWSLLEALCFCDVGHEGERENDTVSVIWWSFSWCSTWKVLFNI